MIAAAIVLAAGKSERMGCNKLLLRLNGHTVLDHILNATTAAHLKETVVVLGYRHEELIDVVALRHDTVRIVVNHDHAHGMATSFQKGLRALRHVDAAFLVLGDQPMLDPTLLNEMVQCLKDHQEALIVSPTHNGKRGHPVLFHRALFGEILSLDNAATIRDIIHRHADRVLTVEAPEWTTLDMDTPTEYRRICALMKHGRYS
ncbi:MAG: nucleotidyltransferase family protein [Halobacteriota archaeon]